jgi:hypothetical protein
VICPNDNHKKYDDVSIISANLLAHSELFAGISKAKGCEMAQSMNGAPNTLFKFIANLIDMISRSTVSISRVLTRTQMKEASVPCEVIQLVTVRISECALFNPIKGTMGVMVCNGVIEAQGTEGAKQLFALFGYECRNSLYRDLTHWCEANLLPEPKFIALETDQSSNRRPA